MSKEITMTVKQAVAAAKLMNELAEGAKQDGQIVLAQDRGVVRVFPVGPGRVRRVDKAGR